MKVYEILVVETRKRTVAVQASSGTEALDKAGELYYDDAIDMEDSETEINMTIDEVINLE